MKKLIERYNQTKSIIDLHKIEHKMREKIEEKLNLKDKKTFIQLNLIDDICMYPKFWFKISLLGFGKKYRRWYDLREKFIITWYDLIELYNKTYDFVKNNTDLFIYQ